MKVAVPHHTTPAKAKKIIEQRLRAAEKQYADKADDLDYQWNGYILHIAAKARGFSLKGTLEITETDVIVDGRLPLLAMPFESKIRHAVEKEAESMFRMA